MASAGTSYGNLDAVFAKHAEEIGKRCATLSKENKFRIRLWMEKLREPVRFWPMTMNARWTQRQRWNGVSKTSRLIPTRTTERD